jgi:hypothetical protein
MSKKRHTQAKRVESSPQPAESIVYDSPEWKAANELVNSYQHSVNEIRAGRERVGHILGERWSDWYNTLMTICFALGGALIAVAPVLKFKTTADQVLFWASTCLLIFDGLYILLLRKARLERESVGAISMGYEIEYYSLVAKNRVLDILKGQQFKADEFEAAKNMLLNQALGELDVSYEETRKIDEHMDIMTVIFLASLGMLCLSRISNTIWLQVWAIAALAALLVLLLLLRAGAIKPKEALKKRDEWLDKIKPERTRK